MTENKKNKEKKKSVIVGLIRKFKNAFYTKAATGFFGRKSKLHEKANTKLENSFAASIIGKHSKIGKAVAKSRFFVSDMFEKSLSMHLWRKFLRFLIGCRLRIYGALFASFGLSVLLGYFAKNLIFSGSESNIATRLALSVSLILVSIPMLITNKNFSEAFGESLMGRFLLQKTLGVSESKFEVSDIKRGNEYTFPMILGVLLGALSIFVDPLILTFAPAVIALIAIIFYSPEAGVVITFIGLPVATFFGNDTVLIVSILLFSASYLVKLARGKRIIRFEITDLLIMLFALVIICGGIKSDANAITTIVYPLIVIFGSFVIGNLMRTKLWQKRFISAYVFSASLIAAAEIIKVAFSKATGVETVFSKYGFASTPDAAATFILPALFAAVAFIMYSKSAREKFASLLIALLIGFALVLSDSAAGYHLLIGFLVFFLLVKRETVSFVTVWIFAVPATLILLPWSVARTIGKAFDLSPVINYSSTKIFQGSFSAISRFWFSGIGYGDFDVVYKHFAVFGFENADPLPSTLLKIFENHGIIGILLILSVFAMFFINCFEFIKESVWLKSRTIVVAGVSAMICLLIKSILFNTAGDIKLLLVMFSTFYITCAGVRGGRQEIEKAKTVGENSEFSASIEI